MRRGATALAIAAVTGLALAGCSGSGGSSSKPELKVADAYMPKPVGDGEMAAGYVTVRNSGGTADKLTSVTSTLSDDITMHVTKDQKMEQVSSLPVPAKGELDLERGGNHLMFMGLKKQPEIGEKVAVELHFEKADPIKVELPVKETTYNPKNS
ncbi:copper chaperone PCu(A)C [Streptomyces beijiangensis]|uniref:Copper chaperone PCu(A)C n=1 Tax=Streptomyces beijiangensis TaxID=163361 RepID=A0A939JBT4_9ACTN|nr:copper chaperone PCu(A)C [Streptomyces beijiangensis]MBO0510286.1 copper chaperone PCu(A)C [Streptomyces beijiangensis]